MAHPFRALPTLAAVLILAVLATFGFPVVGGPGPAGAAGLAAQCLEGQIANADGSGCLLAPATPTPVPTPVPPADDPNAAADEGAQDGESADADAGDDGAEGDEGTEGEEGAEDDAPKYCGEDENPEDDGCEIEPPACPPGFAEDALGQCYEVLDRNHPCVVAGRVPAGVSTNAVLATYTFIPASGECVTQSDFRTRVQNFEASAEAERDALLGLQAITKEVVVIEEALEDLNAELLDVRRELLAAEVEARFAEIRRDATARELDGVRTELAAQQELFKLEAVEAYMGGNNADALAGALLSADNVNDLEATLDYASSILTDQRKTIDRVEELELRTEELVDELSAAILVAKQAADDIRAVEAEVEQLLSDQRDLLAEREQQIQLEAGQIAEIRADKERYAADLGSHAEESKEIATIIAEAQSLQLGVRSNPTAMLSPLDPLKLGSGFGPRLHPILGYVRPHDGVDMSAPSGALITATADGEVIIAGPMGGYGNAVVIDHGDLLSSLYAHQSSLSVFVGDMVEAGDIIGAVGSTGLSTGPHLHFEVRVGGVPVDPIPYLVGDPSEVAVVPDADTASGEFRFSLDGLEISEAEQRSAARTGPNANEAAADDTNGEGADAVPSGELPGQALNQSRRESEPQPLSVRVPLSVLPSETPTAARTEGLANFADGDDQLTD